MDTSDIIQSEIIKELDRIQSTFESHYTDNIDTSITPGAAEYRERLEKFGFNKNRIIRDHRKIRESQKDLEKFNDIASAIQLYKERFPFYKVIPLTLMIKIAEKYNLFFSKNENFIGDIPLKNLNDLEEFKKQMELSFFPVEMGKNILEIQSKKYKDILSFIDAGVTRYGMSSDKYRGFKDFHITAPLDQFTSDKSIIKIGHLLIKDASQSLKQYKDIYREMTRPKDPIIWVPVSFPINGGACMIISKWGEEAKYPEFTNPIDN